MTRPTLIVFARAPVAGQVKRRLAGDIGYAAAARLYRLWLAGILRRVGSDPRWLTVLAVTPPSAGSDIGLWPAALPCVPQGQGDLGARMARVIRAFGPGPVIVIGSDIPEIAAADIVAGFDVLGRKDAVFGPAPDGGYWLVGWSGRRPLPRHAFVDVRWSTCHARADTLASLSPAADIGMLRWLEDIDDLAAFIRWRRRRRVKTKQEGTP